jgi:hypothetical protein
MAENVELQPLIPEEDRENERDEGETAFIEGDDNEGLELGDPENYFNFGKEVILDDVDIDLNNTETLDNLEEIFHADMRDKVNFFFNELQVSIDPKDGNFFLKVY